MKILRFFTRKIFYIPAILVVLAVAGFALFGGNGEPDFETQILGTSTVTNIVSESGTVQANRNVDLSFARGGTVSAVYVQKGEMVTRGQLLAVLNSSALQAQLDQALASLERANTERTVERAEVSLEDAKQNLVRALTDAYHTADDAIRNKADQAFQNDGTDTPKLVYAGTGYFERQDTNRARADMRIVLQDWRNSIDNFSADVNLQPHIDIARTSLSALQSYITELSFTVNRFRPVEGSVTVADISSYQAAVSAARTSINSTISAVDRAVQSYSSEQLALEKRNSSESEVVALQSIRIRELQAQVNAVRANINDGRIISPFDGVVAEVRITVGETAGATSPAISVISEGDLEISVQIPEDDIAFVDVGDRAEVRFDAYNDVVFDAEVVYIAPRATLIDGIPSVEVVLEFEDDSRIKAGLTADVDIVTEVRDNVISVPRRSIVGRGGDQFVRVMESETSYRMQPIVLGLRGEGGVIEVVQGLKVGDRIITFANENSLKSLTEIE